MRHKRQRRQLRPMADINIVPYIDVMLVLLVIFMITTPLLSQGVAVKLPDAKAKTLKAQQQPIVVSVNAVGQYFLNTAKQPSMPIDQQTLLQDVSNALQQEKAQGKTSPVLVKADREVSYGKVMHAMVLLQQAGVDNVGLVTEDKDR